MGPIALFRNIRDFGIPPDLPQEEAKYVRALNLGVIFSALTFILWAVDALVKNALVSFAVYLAWAVVLLAILGLVKKGLHLTGKITLVVLFNLHSLIAAVFLHGQYYDKWNILFAAMTPLLFSRKETRWMAAMIGLCFATYFLKPVVGAYFQPIYPSPNPGAEFGGDTLSTVVFYGLLVAAPLIYQRISTRSDELLMEEKRKVHTLSEKLKLYLPRQFVDSLARGERDTLPDYRRKRLTIFFSDVQGFTKWTDKLEPEEVREILNHYLSDMSAIALKWGGTIDKFIGDCLMIFFGDPEFTDDRDHALRCVKMAMEMQEKMTELRGGWRKMAYDEPLNIRIGINTGWATVGNFGSEDRLNYTALGSAVNLASRLEAACAPDKITVSHTTYLLIEDEIECEAQGEITVKGFAEPLKIYEVKGLKPAQNQSA